MSHYAGRKKRGHFTNHSRVPREALYWAQFSIQTWGLREKYARILQELMRNQPKHTNPDDRFKDPANQLLLAAE
jgi:hypothetical protein